MSYSPYPQQSGGYPSPQQQPGNGLAIAGMVCGIVGLLLFGIILGPLALIFGIVGLNRANKGAKYKGMAIAGIVLGAIDTIFAIIFLVLIAKHGGVFYFHTS